MDVTQIDDNETCLPRSIGENNTLAYYTELGIHNYTGTVIYVCDGIGKVLTLNPDVYNSCNSNNRNVVITYREAYADEREYNSFGREIPSDKKGFKVKQYVIPLSIIKQGNCVYLNKLNLCVGNTESRVINAHPKLTKNVNKYLQDTAQIYKAALETAPIKIMCNDNTGFLQKLYLNVGQHVLSVHVSNKPDVKSYCTLHLGTNSNEYKEYDIDLKSIIEGNIFECVTEKNTFCISANSMLVEKWLYEKSISEHVFTKADLQKYIKNTTEKYKNEMSILEETIRTQKIEIKTYLDTIASYNNRDIEEEKRKLEKDQREFTREKMQFDYAKMKEEAAHEKRMREEKEKIEQIKKDAESASYWNTYLKSALVIIPVLVALGALAKGYFGGNLPSS